MSFIADFHIHSKYSRATSRELDLEHIYKWAKIKGINVVGTGDFTHPLWFKEIKEKLVEDESGLLTLKKEISKKIDKELPKSIRNNKMQFILSTEISNIYKKNDEVRKLHNVILIKDLKTVAEFNSQLARIGNLKSDGRPILGLDSKELLKLVIKLENNSYYIPAHIWTPWFSMFGSRSGFDSIEEAFDEYSSYITAIETGLSSDPFMNWRLSALDKVAIISNSDAHSPQKLGREANIFDSQKDYDSIINSIKKNDEGLIGTIEFFPEEGKYHYDGHAKCNVRFKPSESIEHKLLCPRCGKRLVLGVDYRVTQLADRKENFIPEKHKKVEYIIPLPEILAEIKGVKGVHTKSVQDEYFKLISEFGNEFSILRTVPIQEIKITRYEVLAKALDNLRKGEVSVEPGYDGIFGKIKVFEDEDKRKKSIGQFTMFS